MCHVRPTRGWEEHGAGVKARAHKIYVKGHAAELLSGCRMLSCFSICGGDGLITADMKAVGVVVSFLAVNKILETISL